MRFHVKVFFLSLFLHFVWCVHYEFHTFKYLPRDATLTNHHRRHCKCITNSWWAHCDASLPHTQLHICLLVYRNDARATHDRERERPRKMRKCKESNGMTKHKYIFVCELDCHAAMPRCNKCIYRTFVCVCFLKYEICVTCMRSSMHTLRLMCVAEYTFRGRELRNNKSMNGSLITHLIAQNHIPKCKMSRKNEI